LKNITLNKEQKDIFSFIKKLPIQQKTVVILTGIAGTGKTTLISKLYEDKGKYDEIIVSSLTGKAAQVLRSKGIKDAKTIRSFLDGKPRISLKVINKKTLEEQRKRLGIKEDSKITALIQNFSQWNTLKADLGDYKNRLFIFDEASMITDVPERDSGLLNQRSSSETLLDKIYRKINNSSGNWHVLLVGDRNQLPPPTPRPNKDNPYSDALSKSYWEQKIDKVFHFNLDSIQRTAEASNIYKFTHSLRKGGDYKNFIDGKTVINLIDANVATSYFSNYMKKDNRSAFFISPNNYGVHKKNEIIRKELLKKEDDRHIEEIDCIVPNITKSDILTITKNNYMFKVDLFNGDRVLVAKEPNWKGIEKKEVLIPRQTVKASIDNSEIIETTFKEIELSKPRHSKEVTNMEKEDRRNFPIYYKDAEEFNTQNWTHTNNLIKRELIFADLDIEVMSDEYNRKFKVKVFLNSLFLMKLGNRKAQDLENKILQLCLMQNFLERYSNLSDEENKERLLEKLDEDPYVQSLWTSWGYAGNAHKSQGSEWPHVFVDLNRSEWAGPSWAYTALTRAQKSITILGLENYKGKLQIDDLNTIGVDKISNFVSDKKANQDDQVLDKNPSTNQKTVLNSIKKFITTYKKDEDKNEPLLKLLNELENVLEEINLLPKKETKNKGYLEKRKEFPRHGMPWNEKEKDTLVKLIKARSNLLSSGLLKNTKHVDPESLLETIAKDMQRTVGSIGMTWLRLHKEGKVSMPYQLVDKYSARLKPDENSEANELLADEDIEREIYNINEENITEEEHAEEMHKKAAVEKLTGSNLSYDQYEELKRLFKQDEEDIFE